MRKKRVPFVEQIEHSECGISCVAMILGYYGHHISLTSLREEFGVPKGGHTLSNINEIFNNKKCASKGFRASTLDLGQFTLPVILFWENKHFVVLEKIKNNHFYIVDPSHGNRKLGAEEFDKLYSGVLLEVKPNLLLEKTKKKSSVHFLLSYVLKNPILIFKILLLTFGIQALSISIPYITAFITDKVIVTKELSSLPMIGLLICMLFIGFSALSILRIFTVAKLQTLMDYFMMSNFMDHLLKLPYRFFENRSSGELIFRANSNMYIRQILSTRTVTLIVDSLLLFVYMLLMMRISISMSMIVLGIGVTILILLILSSKITKNLSKLNIHTQTRVQNSLTESITGIVDVKMMGNEDLILEEWEKDFKKQLSNTEKQNKWTGSISSITTSLQFIFTLSILWYGASMVIKGDITLGTLLAFNTLALSFITPLISLGTTYIDFVVVGTFVQRLYDVIGATSENLTEGSNNVDTLKGKIEFSNVSFKYDEFAKNTVENLNFVINPGERVAVVGLSGSGKSTIAKLILGLYIPTEGEILIDNQPLQEFNPRKIRSKMGAVLQDARLFNKSLYENLINNQKEATYEDAVEATRIACIHDEIIKYPMGLFTIASENGLNFSGGQKQRFILARALLKKPAILVLDEATSALDSVTESQITKNIRENIACTTLVITHRLSTIMQADKIIVINDGKVKGIGSYEELKKSNELFQDLYKTQLIEEEEQNELEVHMV